MYYKLQFTGGDGEDLDIYGNPVGDRSERAVFDSLTLASEYAAKWGEKARLDYGCGIAVEWLDVEDGETVEGTVITR